MFVDRVKFTYIDSAKDAMGIKIKNENIEFLLPVTFRENCDEKELKKDLLKFLASLEYSSVHNNGNISEGGSSDKSQNWPVASFLWIINDYLENGIYYNREKNYANDNKGRIVWKRTLKRSPILSGGNIIYSDFVTSRMTSVENEISQIYRICLKIAVDCVGWAFNFNFPVEINRKKSRQEMLHLLKREYASTFDDVKKLRFKHMIAILKNIDDDSMTSSKYIYTINNYYYVFETMVDKLFKGITGSVKKKFNPKGSWFLNGMELMDSSPMRPDTIYMRSNNDVFILDAKMYRYGATCDVRDLPTTASIQKQVTYGNHIFNNILNQDGNVNNAFILPFDKEIRHFPNEKYMQKYLDGNLVYIGYAIPGWLYKEDRTYNKVHTFMIDFMYLMRNHNIETSKYIDKVCEVIDSVNDENESC